MPTSFPFRIHTILIYKCIDQWSSTFFVTRTTFKQSIKLQATSTPSLHFMYYYALLISITILHAYMILRRCLTLRIVHKGLVVLWVYINEASWECPLDKFMMEKAGSKWWVEIKRTTPSTCCTDVGELFCIHNDILVWVWKDGIFADICSSAKWSTFRGNSTGKCWEIADMLTSSKSLKMNATQDSRHTEPLNLSSRSWPSLIRRPPHLSPWFQMQHHFL